MHELDSAQAGGQALKRRGLIAGVAALVAAAAAKLARPETAEANTNGQAFLLGQTDNTPTLTTGITSGAAGQTLYASNNGSGHGILGNSTNNSGLVGTSGALPAVFGQASSGVGVYGTSPASPGVYGNSTSGYGVYGYSQNSNGIAGSSGSGAAGCVGFASAAGGYGLFGGTAVAGGYAGGFQGPVIVAGSFSATGIKSALVPHPAGGHRRLYCLESAESYFEDFGSASLVNGKADVRLDPEFAAVVHNDSYLVFLTAEADSKGLYVTNKTPAGFQVREQQGGTSSLPFSWRVAAKRRDVAGPRLERVTLPDPIEQPFKDTKGRPPGLPNPPGR